MARKRTSMKAIRMVIDLYKTTQLSKRGISAATGVSRPVVAEYLEAFDRSGLNLEQFKVLADTEAMALLREPKMVTDPRYDAALAFFPYIVKELARVGVTRELLWREYKQKQAQGYEYSQFCNLFRIWCKADADVTLHVEHKAGDRMYVDFSGKKPWYFDKETGERKEAEIFVAILGASQYTYVEALRSQQKAQWICANRNALEFFGGVPASIMPDCLKSGVTNGDKYEPQINPEYADFALHYGTVITPARPHCPRDKALVESAVNIMYTRILAPLRDREFQSLEALNEVIWKLLEDHNAKRFQKLPFSRIELFESVDKPALKSLPERHYELTNFKTVTVPFNYHIELYEERHNYSVPWKYAKKQISVAYTTRTVEIYHDNVRIAFHKRATTPGYTTNPEHMPAHHRFYLEWSPERIISWAGEISVHARTLVQIILDRATHPEQSYKSCIGIISLSKKYSIERLDRACRMAISEQAISYRAVKSILEKERDLVVLNDERNQRTLPFHENLRGQSAYG